MAKKLEIFFFNEEQIKSGLNKMVKKIHLRLLLHFLKTCFKFKGHLLILKTFEAICTEFLSGRQGICDLWPKECSVHREGQSIWS